MSDTTPKTGLAALDERMRDIFREIVENYLHSGGPVGSRTLAQAGKLALSPASIRNTMADLAQMGLLSAPHASAGRMPTHAGLRLFVDGLLQVGELNAAERGAIEGRVATTGRTVPDLLNEVSAVLGGLAEPLHRGGLVLGDAGARRPLQAHTRGCMDCIHASHVKTQSK